MPVGEPLPAPRPGGRSPRVVVLFHEHDPIATRPYLVLALAERWRSLGIETVIHRGLAAPPDGDLAILHVDLTRVPKAYHRLAQRYPRVLNGTIVDIGKRHLDFVRVGRGDGYAGPVIVKTDRNHFGLPERELRHRLREASRPRWLRAARRMTAKLAVALPWWVTGNVGHERYPVLASPREVPPTVWFDPRFVVDRFVPERAGDLFVLRRWNFLGNASVNFAGYGTTAWLTSKTTLRRELLGPPPPEVVAIRRAFALDLGKIDYAMPDGRVVVYDVNKTPGGSASPEYQRLLVDELAPALSAMR